MSDWSDKSDRSDLSAAFAADTTIIDMRTPQQHSRAAADLTPVSKQTNAPPQMSGVASITKAAKTNPLVTVCYRLLPFVTVCYR
jgi:hypothetical protein